MFNSRRWCGFLAMMALASCMTGASAAEPNLAIQRRAASELSEADLKKLVDARVNEWEIKPEDRRFDEIGWTTSLLEARRLAQRHGRPIFLFTHDGRMAIGRC